MTKKQKKLSAKELLAWMQGESELTANFTGMWDRLTFTNPRLVDINRGNGFEECVACSCESADKRKGTFVYIGPYKLENKPTATTKLSFYCDWAWCIVEK